MLHQVISELMSVMLCMMLAVALPTAAAMSGNYHVVNIVGLPGGGTQSLPTTYVQTFPRWQVTATTTNDDDDDGKETTVVKKDVVTAGRSNVNLSLDWSPTLQARPALEFLIKSGIPTYVMAGLQLQHQSSSSDNNISNNNIKSIPLARQWTTFGYAVEPNFRIEVFQHADDDDNQKKESDDDEDSASSSVVAWSFGDKPAKQLQAALESLGVVLSQLGDDSELLDGFHIVSIPLKTPTGWMSVPQPTSAAGNYRVSCLATAEPDAETLLTIEQDLLEMTASSLLEMTVVGGSAASTGGEEL